MRIAVKICGITSTEAADAAIASGAVYGGLVFHPKSPRFVRPQTAQVLAERMRGRLKIAALMADPDDSAIAGAMEAAQPDLLQLHGSESAGRVAAIRARFGLPVIKALGLRDATDLAAVPDYEAAADMLLFDARAPQDAAYPGGHGAAFDWKILHGRNFRRPWFLAGGLDPDNVARAVALSGATLVDVSSGVESAPGVKSPARIAAFIAAAQGKVQA
jgi:phosphoribosylanthranilate isomerase